ncbi:MAG: efflux RND transporter periplasmic adaptor subunit [Pseudomonadota bacterium]
MPRRRNVLQTTSISGSIVGLATLIISACDQSSDTNSSFDTQMQPIRASVVDVKAEQVTIWDEYIGRFEAVERVDLRPRVSGYLEEVHFADGQNVEEGQLLFTIDRRPFSAAYARAEADVKSAQTQIDLTSVELQRATTLLEARAGSQEEYDQALAANRAAEAALDAAIASRSQAALDLEFTKVTSPIGGRVSDARLERGNFVAAGETLLTTVVSVDPIHFSFTGSEQRFLNYLRLDRAGIRGSSIDTPNPVRIQLADQEDFPIEGQMTFLDNTIDPTTSTIRATAVVQNSDGFLTPGLFGRLQLFEQETEAIIVPDTAVQFDQSRRFVWVVGNQLKAEQRTVELGRDLGGGRRQIISGIEEGEQVIVGNLFMLRPGVPILPVARQKDQSRG